MCSRICRVERERGGGFMPIAYVGGMWIGGDGPAGASVQGEMANLGIGGGKRGVLR